jgi:hypothetical protein
MATSEEDRPASLSPDAARAGVVGHNVRYVLAFGLVGVIIAFVAIAIYYGFDRVVRAISQIFTYDPVALIGGGAPYVVIIVVAAIIAVILLGLWNRIAGRSDDTSQIGMRIRVVLQFVIIFAAMAILYLSMR